MSDLRAKMYPADRFGYTASDYWRQERENEMSEPAEEEIIYRHFRLCKSDGKYYARGGATAALLVYDRREVYAVGIAVCSLSDNYCRRIGRQISRHRVLKKPYARFQFEEISNKRLLEMVRGEFARVTARVMKKLDPELESRFWFDEDRFSRGIADNLTKLLELTPVREEEK